MFTLFAELISFHLASLHQDEEMSRQLGDSNRVLNNLRDELRQYQHLSNHNLQEPLRKIRLFSDILLKANERGDDEKIKTSANKINSFARGLSELIRDLSDFSGLSLGDKAFETTDLNIILLNVCDRLGLRMKERGATINSEVLHTIKAVPGQIARLMYHLLNNALKYTGPGVAPTISIYSKDLGPGNVSSYPQLAAHRHYCELCFEDNGIGIEADQLEKIFDISPRISSNGHKTGLGIGLAQCRRIAHNHGGIIFARNNPGKGTTFSVVLPIE